MIFNHCEYQDQLLIFSVTDMSIFLFVIIITEKESLETKKNPSKLWIYLLDPFDSLEFWDWTLVTDVDIGLVPELVVDVGDDCLVLDQSRHSCCNNKSIFDTLSKEIRQV